MRHFWTMGFISIGWLLTTQPVFAHSLDISYLDVGVTTSSQLTLTVALHPHQAFELVREGPTGAFDLATLRENGELVAAYVESHVAVTRNGELCTWSPETAVVAETEFEADAEGMTIQAPLDCPGEGTVIGIQSTLFLEGFPNQSSVVRLDLPGGYAERFTLNRTHLQGELDTAELSFVASEKDVVTSSWEGDPPLLRMIGWATVLGVLILAFISRFRQQV